MKHVVLTAACLLGTGLCSAQEMARVISSTPVVQQVGVPRQVCSNEQVAVQPAKSGAGALMGAVAGGAVGNAVGSGGGRAIATMIGVIGGALMGDRVEGTPPAQVQQVQNCHSQTFLENRVVAYNVLYEYGGKQYSVQMPQDPGPSLRVQVTPVVQNPVRPGVSMAPAAAPIYPPAVQAPVATTSRGWLRPAPELDRWPDGSPRPPGGEDIQRY